MAAGKTSKLSKAPKSKSDSSNRIRSAYAELERAHQDIKEAHMAIVLRLAIVAEYRDEDTGAHIMRISEYGSALAKEIGLSEAEIETFRFSSPLHDIGKIAIPDYILKKKGKLTEKEFEIMKDHTVIGARMFENSSSPILRAAADICRSHHEKWDGSGYPFGLKGEKIPLMARITTLVDVFDALTSKRCYKEAWPFQMGVDYLKEGAGKQFEPRLVNAFVRIQPTIKKIYEANLSLQKTIKELNMPEIGNVKEKTEEEINEEEG